MKLFDWLGSARRLNDEVNADALRIASLELGRVGDKETIQTLNEQLARALKNGNVWRIKAEGLQAALKTARAEIEELEANEETNWPLVSYALRQKANRAKYDAKRRRK